MASLILAVVTRSSRSIAVALTAGLAAATLAGCAATGSTPSAAPGPSSSADADSATSGLGASSAAASHSASSSSSKPSAKKSASAKHTTKPSSSTASGPRIVSFRIAQHPKCAEGTAVFRADPVPLIIEWKISGATGAALSVDDRTHTAGTYGSVDLQGTEEFAFTCAGDVGTTETHTYAIYTVGGGPQRSATLTASAKILDKGKAS